MSIIIHGMDMPKNKELWIRVQPDGNIVSQTGYVIEDASAEQLSPNGRLINADALINAINRSITEEERVFNSIKEDPIGKHGMWIDIMHDKRIVGILENAPTIIEAEEEEE